MAAACIGCVVQHVECVGFGVLAYNWFGLSPSDGNTSRGHFYMFKMTSTWIQREFILYQYLAQSKKKPADNAGHSRLLCENLLHNDVYTKLEIALP